MFFRLPPVQKHSDCGGVDAAMLIYPHDESDNCSSHVLEQIMALLQGKYFFHPPFYKLVLIVFLLCKEKYETDEDEDAFSDERFSNSFLSH